MAERVHVHVMHEAGHGEATFGISLSHGLNREPHLWAARKESLPVKLAPKQGGHNKFLESMIMWLDVVAPRYWWQQADTYRVSTKQSESTMHTILKSSLTQACFVEPIPESWLKQINELIQAKEFQTLKAWLPEGFLQRRIWMMSYKTFQNIWMQRRSHRLPEWQEFLNGVLHELEHPEYITLAVVDGDVQED